VRQVEAKVVISVVELGEMLDKSSVALTVASTELQLVDKLVEKLAFSTDDEMVSGLAENLAGYSVS